MVMEAKRKSVRTMNRMSNSDVLTVSNEIEKTKNTDGRMVPLLLAIGSC